MIDVMFLLLVFYILSTAALVHQQAIPVDLPLSTTSRPSEAPDVTVTVTRSGGLFLDKEPVSLEGLPEAVERLAATRPGGLKALQDDGVILSADLEVTHGQVVAVMDALRQLGIARFALSTAPK